MPIFRYTRSDFAWVTGLALTYFAAAQIVPRHFPAGERFGLLQAQSGVGLAALLVLGLRAWPGVAFGALLTATTSSLAVGSVSLDTLGCTLQPLLTAAVLRTPSLRFDPQLQRLHDYLLLVAIGGIAAPVIGATFLAGAMTYDAGHAGLSLTDLWFEGWLGNALGVVMLTPPLLLSAKRYRNGQARFSPWQVAALASLAFWCATVFGGLLKLHLHPLAEVITIFPLLCWISLCFGQMSAMLAAIVVLAFSLYGTGHGLGPFAGDFGRTGLHTLWLFNAILGATAAVLGTVTNERRQTVAKLRQAARVFESTHEALLITDLHDVILAVNPAFTQITGYLSSEVIGKNRSLLHSGRHSEGFFEEQRKELASGGRWQGEVWNRRKSGETYPEWQTISTVTDSAGRSINYVTVFSDISQQKISQEKLEYLAHHDALTGLPNRVLFRDRLEHAITRADRAG